MPTPLLAYLPPSHLIQGWQNWSGESGSRECRSHHWTRVVHSLAPSRLDFCNALYAGLPLNMVWKRHFVQNAVAKLLTGTAAGDYSLPILSCPFLSGNNVVLTYQVHIIWTPEHWKGSLLPLNLFTYFHLFSEPDLSVSCFKCSASDLQWTRGRQDQGLVSPGTSSRDSLPLFQNFSEALEAPA